MCMKIQNAIQTNSKIFQVTQIKNKLTFYALWTFSDIIVPLIRVLKKKHLKALGKTQSQRFYIHFNILCTPMNI